MWAEENLCSNERVSVGNKVSLCESEYLWEAEYPWEANDHFECHFSIHNKGYSLSSFSVNIRKTLHSNSFLYSIGAHPP